MTPVSVVVLNWNTRDLTLRCVRTLRTKTSVPFELIIVDNGSRDGSPDAFARLVDARTRLVSLPENLGFSGGCNAGIAASSGGPILLLNSDAFVTHGAVASLLQHLDDPNVGLVGPYTNNSKGAQRRRPWFGSIPPPLRPTLRVDYLSFFCVLISRPVIDRIGGLDTRFRIGCFEDDDYCRRVRDAGFDLVIDGGSWVWHEAHATFRANGLDDRVVQEKNRSLFDEKWGAS